jgi:WS/DGAT/MGAT family acyltransferase
MQRLSGLDTAFLYLETPTVHMTVQAVMLLDTSTVPGGYSFEKIKSHLQSRLPQLPEFRRRLAPVPFDLHRPVWFDDPDFDFDYHVRHVAVPSPGSAKQVADLVGDIAGRSLDRSRPLWEFWVIEGVEAGTVAIVARMHHSTIDGVSGSSLLTTILDMEPDPVETPVVDDFTPEHKPSDVELVRHAIISRLRRPLPLGLALAMPAVLRGAVAITRVRRDRSTPSGGTPFNTPRTPWNAPLTPHRRVAFASVSLDEVKEMKNAFGCTVNDIVLATATGALRRYLSEHDTVPDQPLLAACPVSVRTDETEHIESANKVSAMFVSLPTHLDDVEDQIAHIRDATKGAKEEHQAVGARTLLELGELAGPRTFGLAARLLGGLAARGPVPINLVISNVPGPPFPLYLGGARVVSMLPLGPAIEGAGLNVTVMSYIDRIDWGFIACRELAPQLQDMANAVEDAHIELLKAATSLRLA